MAGLLDSIAPSYQDYLKLHPDQSGFSESGASINMNEGAYNALSNAEKWALVHEANLSPGAAGYDQLAQAGGVTGGKPVTAFQQGYLGNNSTFTDPSKTRTAGGLLVSPGDNFVRQGMGMPGWFEAGLAAMLGGAGYAAMGGAGAGAAAGEGAASAGEGLGTGAGYAEGWSGAAGAGADPTLAATGGGGLAAGTSGLGTGAPVSEIPAGSSVAGTNQGLLSGLSSQGGVTGLLGQAGQWAMSNPLRAAGLAQMAYGLLASHGNSGAPSGGSSGSSGSAKGGAGQGLTQGNGMQQQFYVNPYTLAQLQRSRGGQ